MRRLLYIILFLIILFCFGWIGYLHYVAVPFPSPKPYPGSKVTQGEPYFLLGLRHVDFRYTVNRPLDEVQHHYEAEMTQYCEDGWRFKNTKDMCASYHLDCRVAICEIPRPFVRNPPQTFFVYLRSISETETDVACLQINYW